MLDETLHIRSGGIWMCIHVLRDAPLEFEGGGRKFCQGMNFLFLFFLFSCFLFFSSLNGGGLLIVF